MLASSNAKITALSDKWACRVNILNEAHCHPVAFATSAAIARWKMSLLSPRPRAPRNALTLQKKFEVIKLAEEDPKLGLRKLADLFDCGKTQISSILKDKDTILELYNGNLLSKDAYFRKKCRSCEFYEVNEALYKWYEANSVGVYPPGALLCQKAKEIAECLDIPNFKASNGWLYRWKKRYISQFRTNGELTEVIVL